MKNYKRSNKIETKRSKRFIKPFYKRENYVIGLLKIMSWRIVENNMMPN